MLITLIILTALLLDYCLGEPRRYHPLVGLGWLATQLEKLCNKTPKHPIYHRLFGLLAVLTLVIPITFIFSATTVFIQQLWLQAVVSAIILYLAIAPRSLEQHAQQILQPLLSGDLTAARKHVSYMVSRDTQHLDEPGITRATIESVLENGNDAIFAPIFWFALAGIPGVVCYRIINTLDAMWGYRNERFIYFGWAAARADDVMNWLPARCCSVAYSFAGGLTGHFQQALDCWKAQAKKMASPNGGPVMASGAGALNIKLGGIAIYHGLPQERPVFGVGNLPKANDINRTLILLRKALALFIVTIFLSELVIRSYFPLIGSSLS